LIEAPASTPSARGVVVESVHDVCRFVDELEGRGAGELVVTGDAALGAVFVQDARICWAAAAGLASRLTELLMSHAGVDHRTMERLYWTCKRESLPLGEYLVDRGIVRPEDLRSVLAQHTVESLLTLVGPGRCARWLPRPHGGYSARFTFGTSEVLSLAGGICEPELVGCALDEMAGCFFSDEWAAAFVRTGDRAAPHPVALYGPAPESAAVLVRHAKWAISALDVVAAFGGAPEIVAVTLPERRGARALVAYWYDGLVIVAEGDPQCAARVLNRRGQRKRGRG